MPLLDEHGVSTGAVPAFVHRGNLARWILCAAIAERITQQDIGQPEAQMFANWLFDNPAVRDPRPEEVPVELLESAELAEALEEARVPREVLSRAAAEHARKAWRNRLGQFRDMPDAPDADAGGKVLPPRHPTPEPDITEAEIEALGLNDWPEPGPKAKEILGEAQETTEIYAAGPPLSPGTDPVRLVPYTPERTRLHEEIRAHFFSGKTPPDLAEGERPRALFTAGGPASGKTTTLNRLRERGDDMAPPDEHTIHIDADEVKKFLPEYQALVEAEDPYAATAVHEESGDIAAMMALEATEQGFHVVWDQTGNGPPGAFRRLLDFVSGRGYDVGVVYVSIPTEEAVKTAIKRAREEGRHVPLNVVRRQHRSVSANFMTDVVDFPGLAALDVISEGVHVATWNDGLQVIDRKRFLAFVEKAEEPEV